MELNQGRLRLQRGVGQHWCWWKLLLGGRSLHISSVTLWFWLNDSSEAHVRKRISPWDGIPQRDGVKLAQSSYALSSMFCRPPNILLLHLLAPLSIAMIYPQLVQPSTPASPLRFTLLTPHHNLLCHPDLPVPIHFKQTTTHGWSQDVSCPLALRWRPVACQWGVNHPLLIKTSITLSNPMETCCKKT